MTVNIALARNLRSTQQWFLDVITHPESAKSGVENQRCLVPVERLDGVIRPGRTESALDRLAIYQHSYFARLTECLADDYPALKFALGPDSFDALCCAYAVAHASNEPSLNGFGRHLPQFVRQQVPEIGDFACDLARLQWALVEVVHASAPESFSADLLQTVPPQELPNLRFVPSGALRLLEFAYPANEYLQAFFEERSPVLPEQRESFVAVVRYGYTLWRFDLSQVQWTLLKRLATGEPLGCALDGIDATAAQVRVWFSDWTAHGLFAGIQTDTA